MPVPDPSSPEREIANSVSGGGRPIRNKLLRALPADDFAALQPHLEYLELDVGHIIAEAGEAFEHVYFPEGGVVSIVNYMVDGSAVETGTIGDEGMAGLAAYLEADASEGKTFIQVAGGARRMPAKKFVEIAADRPAIRHLINRFVQAYLTQVAQAAACNRLHSIEQRCARWLLMTHDRVGEPRMMLKHEFLALMLGVRRAGVTIAAGALQEAGLIRYRRGSIRVLDREGLEKASCECYGIIRKHFDRLLPET